MPLEEADAVKLIQSEVGKALEPFKALPDKIDRLNADIPGIVKRLAEDTNKEVFKRLDELKPKADEKGKAKEQQHTTGQPNEDVEALKAEVEAMKAEKRQAKIEAELERALSKVELVDGAADLGREALKSMVKQREDGTFYIPTKRKLDTTGQEISEDVSVEIGVQRFFDVRPGLKAAKVKGGSGAGSSGGGADGDPFDGATYADLLKNPASMAAALKKDPARVAKLRAENDKARK